jgi:3-deoxy-manno-octulosonate cytidylyltransferase (CMP-KDO synthetase)
MRALDQRGAPVSALIVIPARLGATRLPQKPLRDLGGKPLIVRVVERVMAHGASDRIVVATDSVEVADVVRAAGAEAVMTRGDHPSGTDRIAEVVSSNSSFKRFDVVLNVQGDEPFVTAETLAAARGMVESGDFPLGTAACPAPASILDQPDVVKVIRDETGRAMYFSRSAIPHLRDGADRAHRDGLVLRHIGVYAYTPKALAAWVALAPSALELAERLEQLRPLAAGIPMGVGVTTNAGAAGIDTEEDLRRANAAWPELNTSAHSPVTAGIR